MRKEGEERKDHTLIVYDINTEVVRTYQLLRTSWSPFLALKLQSMLIMTNHSLLPEAIRKFRSPIEIH